MSAQMSMRHTCGMNTYRDQQTCRLTPLSEPDY
jgi:hypothetical protein